MTYQQLLTAFQQVGMPGANNAAPYSDAWNQAFNSWSSQVMQANGASNWEGIPDNGVTTWQNSLSQQQPVTNTPAPTGQVPTVTAPAATATAPAVNTPTTFAAPTQAGGNYNQTQSASQAGNYASVGQTNQAQSTTGGQNTSQTNTQDSTFGNTQTVNQNVNQTGTTNTAGTTQQNTTGQQTGQFSQTGNEATNQVNEYSGQTNVIDTLGFGNLLQSAGAGAQQTDANRTAFLTDLMQTGGSAFQGQIDQAVRNSLSGPQITGAGDSARARTAGYAAAQVARNNTAERLNAAAQLAGPSALTSLVSAGTPFLGQQTSGTQAGSQQSASNVTGTNTATNQSTTSGSSNTQQDTANNTATTGTTANTGTQSTTGSSQSASNMWQNLLNIVNEASSSSAAASSAQAGSGNLPEGQPVKTGGCVICTAGIELGLWKHKRVLRYVVQHKLLKDWARYRRAARGYFLLFTPLAEWFLKHPFAYKLFQALPRMVVYEELRVAGKWLRFKLGPWLLHWAWHWGCYAIGLLPIPEHVRSESIVHIARREGVFFNVKG